MKITGKELLEIMGVSQEHYNNFKVPVLNGGFQCFDMSKLHSSEFDLREPVHKASDGAYKSGGIWIDYMYQVVYLYLGKTDTLKDVVLIIGDFTEMGEIKYGKIDPDQSKEEGFFFDGLALPVQ